MAPSPLDFSYRYCSIAANGDRPETRLAAHRPTPFQVSLGSGMSEAERLPPAQLVDRAEPVAVEHRHIRIGRAGTARAIEVRQADDAAAGGWWRAISTNAPLSVSR